MILGMWRWRVFNSFVNVIDTAQMHFLRISPPVGRVLPLGRHRQRHVRPFLILYICRCRASHSFVFSISRLDQTLNPQLTLSKGIFAIFHRYFVMAQHKSKVNWLAPFHSTFLLQEAPTLVCPIRPKKSKASTEPENPRFYSMGGWRRISLPGTEAGFWPARTQSKRSTSQNKSNTGRTRASFGTYSFSLLPRYFELRDPAPMRRSRDSLKTDSRLLYPMERLPWCF